MLMSMRSQEMQKITKAINTNDLKNADKIQDDERLLKLAVQLQQGVQSVLLWLAQLAYACPFPVRLDLMRAMLSPCTSGELG